MDVDTKTNWTELWHEQRNHFKATIYDNDFIPQKPFGRQVRFLIYPSEESFYVFEYFLNKHTFQTLANDNIVFQNSGGEYDDLPGNWDMIDGESSVIIRTKTALSNYLPKDYSIQRIMLHEMGHGVDLDGDDGLQLSSNPEVISLIKKLKHSSYYARTKKGNSKYTEEIADAISMVAYKDKIDKSTALIQVPVYDNKGKLVGQEVLDYWRWHERYNKLAVYLENALGL